MARVIVVGAGAAGLLAAGRAAELGAQVLLLEKMTRPGRKLRITGKGRCNVTNTASMADFTAQFGKNGRFLRPAFSRFFATEMLALLDSLGVPHKVERGGRVFPASDQAQDVVDALQRWVKRRGVKLRKETPVHSLILEEGRAVGVAGDGWAERGDAVILCLGGASYKGTGSSGDGYALAKAAGHTVIKIRPALVPLVTAEDTAAKLQGLSLRNVEASLWVAGKKASSAFGEMIFTHFGLSGPIVLKLSRFAVDTLAAGEKVELAIDLKPALEHDVLDRRLLRDLDKHGKRHFETLLADLLPRKLIPVCIDETGIPADRPGHQVGAADRKRLRLWLKDFRLAIRKCRPLNEAIVTAGGVNLKEVDPKTMASRKCPGLYIAGELLDLDAFTGGYNVQAAFSTGWLAGNSAVESKHPGIET